MRLQVLDPAVNFSCNSCTFCCDQPWRTLIEAEKAKVLDGHDFSRYPQLAGQKFYHVLKDVESGFYALAKGEGTRCLFLDRDGLCIIHKELGPQAKPRMCLQFPYLPVATLIDDRISVNFGCPSVQKRLGAPLVEQGDEIGATIPRSTKPVNAEASVPLDLQVRVSQPEADAIVDYAQWLFSDAQPGDIWSRFAELMALLVSVSQLKQKNMLSSTELIDRLKDHQSLPERVDVPPVGCYPDYRKSPGPVRFLFATTLYTDTVPESAKVKAGFLDRLTMIPRLMALLGMAGSYQSRLMKRTISIPEVMSHPVEPDMDAGGLNLLLRYYRSRFWHRLLIGTKLPILGGAHQHLVDLNAILFFARAEALAGGVHRLSEAIIRKSLTYVEFHIANQLRLFEQVFKNWIKTQLCSPSLAAGSLRLMSSPASS